MPVDRDDGAVRAPACDDRCRTCGYLDVLAELGAQQRGDRRRTDLVHIGAVAQGQPQRVGGGSARPSGRAGEERPQQGDRVGEQGVGLDAARRCDLLRHLYEHGARRGGEPRRRWGRLRVEHGGEGVEVAVRDCPHQVVLVAQCGALVGVVGEPVRLGRAVPAPAVTEDRDLRDLRVGAAEDEVWA